VISLHYLEAGRFTDRPFELTAHRIVRTHWSPPLTTNHKEEFARLCQDRCTTRNVLSGTLGGGVLLTYLFGIRYPNNGFHELFLRNAKLRSAFKNPPAVTDPDRYSGKNSANCAAPKRKAGSLPARSYRLF
jgi:hypothetical protein